MFFRMVYKSGPIFLPFCQGSRVWQTDRQTDGRTDGRTDRILIAIPRLHYMQRGKNWPLSSSDLNLVIIYYRKICNKNCIVKISETLIIWSASCYTSGSDKSDTKKECQTDC